tara:strand:+ start:269 stop:505 length:237 start_codon:yes stop_codon:yes gene_type:complete
MELLIIGMVEKYPIIMTILSVMGMARLILKPLMTFLHEMVVVTESTKDNEILDKVEASKIYKGLLFVLDYAFSLKLKK